MTEENSNSGIPMWVCMVVTMIFGAFMALISYGVVDKSWRDECVKHGVAKWTVVNDHGAVEWDWIRTPAH